MNTFEGLFYEGPIPYHELDAEGVIVRVNRAECEMLGYSEEQLMNKPIWEFIRGEEIEVGRALLREKLAGIRKPAPFRRTYVTSDNRHLIVEIHDRVMRDVSGDAVGIRSALIDITERVRAEEALEESRRWLDTILHSIGEAIIAVDAFGWIVHMNAAAERLTGWPMAEVKGTAFETCLRISAICTGGLNDQPLEALFRKCLFEEWRGTGQFTNRSGSVKQVTIRSAPLLQGGDAVAGFVLVLGSRSEVASHTGVAETIPDHVLAGC